MTPDQIAILLILLVTLTMFIWGRWRFDVVALLALLASVLTGLVQAEDAFSGFGHPAVITVAAVLVISRVLVLSGIVDALAGRLIRIARGPVTQNAILCSSAAFAAAFMNNVGALSLMMPIAIASAKKLGYSASRILMPLSFATLLGGMVTLIGTPPNIIISTYRASLSGKPFGMFDFAPTGIVLALTGLVYLVAIGWRMIPKWREGRPDAEDLFQITHYVTEIRIAETSSLVGRSVMEIGARMEEKLQILGIIRDHQRTIGNIRLERISPGDILIVQADATTIRKLTETGDAELVADKERAEDLKEENMALVEVVVTPTSSAVRQTPSTLRLRSQFGINLLAVARAGQHFQARLRNVKQEAGDVLLLQGDADNINSMITAMGFLPLASRGLSLKARRGVLPLAIFAAALAAISIGWLPPAVALVGAATLMAFTGMIPLREIYSSIDWPVIVLLGAMIPVGKAIETAAKPI